MYLKKKNLVQKNFKHKDKQDSIMNPHVYVTKL